MSVLRDLRSRAAARPAHIVMSEGSDPRIVAAAIAATNQGIARITLSDVWETAKAHVIADAYYDAVARGEPPPAPLPDAEESDLFMIGSIDEALRRVQERKEANA